MRKRMVKWAPTYGSNCRDLNAGFEWADDWANRWLLVMATSHSLWLAIPSVASFAADLGRQLSVVGSSVVNSTKLILSVNSISNDMNLHWWDLFCDLIKISLCFWLCLCLCLWFINISVWVNPILVYIDSGKNKKISTYIPFRSLALYTGDSFEMSLYWHKWQSCAWNVHDNLFVNFF